MAMCEKLEVEFVGRGVRETICTSCIHREVCTYKRMYIDFLKALERLYDEYANCISFIKKSDPDCNYYKKKSDVNLR